MFVEGMPLITAHFVPVVTPGETDFEINTGTEGRTSETVTLSTQSGSNLLIPEGVTLTAIASDPLRGAVTATLRDYPVSELAPAAFANWLWAFEVLVRSHGDVLHLQFSTLDDENVVDSEFLSSGVFFRVPLSDSGLPEGTPIDLYRLEDADGDGGQTWRHVACSTIAADGVCDFPIRETGYYALGRRPVTVTPVAPSLGESSLYDCVIEADAVMNRVKVIEDSTAEVFNAWVFDDLTPGQIPETTAWVVRPGDESCMGRLEDYGRRFRVRSPFANAFSATYGLLEVKQDPTTMTGPYEVDASGNPGATPIEDPYPQCERTFAGDVKVVVLSRAGDYTQFKNEVLLPLRATFDTGEEVSSNVQVHWFKKMEEGYYAELWVNTPECTRHVADAMPILEEDGVSLALMRGRLIYVMDWRGGGPYVAYPEVVAQNTALGIRLLDPFWNLEGGVIDDHALGGPGNMILKLVDMEYDAIHDTLWVIMADEDGVFNLFRYDKPAYDYGDRPPDACIDFPTFSLRQLCADAESDRLFVHTSGDAEEDGDGLRVFANASGAPFLENRVTHVAFLYPNETEPHMLLFDYIVPVNNILYLLHGITHGDDSLNVFSYSLNANTFGARFKAWASFGEGRTAPITKGVFSRRNNIVYAATDSDWNPLTAVYAIDNPVSWQSQWIVTDVPGNGHWTPDTPGYRILRWENPGSVWDLDVVEDDREILAVAAAHGLNEGEILLFDNANTASGMLTPLYRLVLTHGNQLVEFINPPPPDALQK